jgi:hypothetical protein
MSKAKRKWQEHPSCSHVFKRVGSDNWHVRLRNAEGRRAVESLGTSDAQEAVILALPKIAEHKARLLAARPRLEASWAWRLEPGREHVAPDGNGKIVATDRELIHIDHNGGILKIEPNGGPANRLVNWPMGAVIVGDTPTRQRLTELRQRYKGATIINLAALERPAVAAKSADDAILETYLKHAEITGH